MTNQTVYLKGRQVVLSQNEYIAAGGEGTIYKKDSLIYKVYHNSMPDGKESHLLSLSGLSHKSIIAPKNIIQSKAGEPVGYTMPFIDQASSLALFFTLSFKKRNNITDNHLESIFLKMSEVLNYIHKKNFLVIDLNELNILISNTDWSTPYFLDVDSYSSAGFPPQVIMPTIKDYRRDDYSAETDWYSFAVLMFQLYTGIHPYLGYHPKHNFIVDASGNRQKAENIPDRRKNLVSVYDKDVKYPAFVKLGQVPSNLTDWFHEVFDKGAYPPPPAQVSGKPVAQTVVAYSVGLKESLREKYGSAIIAVRVVNGSLLVATEDGYYLGSGVSAKRAFAQELPLVYQDDAKVAICSVTKGPDCLVLRNGPQDQRLRVPGIGKISVIRNRLFGIVEDRLMEFSIGKYTKELAASQSWTVLPNASRFFPGMAYCDVFGNAKLYIPEDVAGVPALFVTDLPELNGRQIIDAFYEEGTVVAISKFNGKYERTLAKFDKKFIKATVLQEECSLHEVNAVTLSNGMSVSYDGENIEMSGAGVTSRRLVPVDTDLTLAHLGNKVLGFRGDCLYDLSLS